MKLFEVKSLNRRFGGLHVTRNLSFGLEPGERVALIGPNGAGKSTAVNLMSGVLAPNSGIVTLLGENITRTSQPARVKRGLVRTFQITTLPMGIPIGRLVEMALHERDQRTLGFWKSVDSLPAVREEAADLLASLNLLQLAAKTPSQLAYGQQRLIEMALALALRPKILLLDEPMAGVPKGDGRNMLEAIKRLPKELAVLIVEHDMDLVFNFASRIIVLAEGSVLAAGTPEQIRTHPRVREVYLGSKA